MAAESQIYRNRLIRLAGPWLVPLGLIIVWQVFAGSGLIPHRILPSTLEVMQAGFHLPLTGEMPMHLWESFQRAFAGFVIGGAIGLVLGLVNGFVGPANLVFDRALQMPRNIPHRAMVALSIL